MNRSEELLRMIAGIITEPYMHGYPPQAHISHKYTHICTNIHRLKCTPHMLMKMGEKREIVGAD